MTNANVSLTFLHHHRKVLESWVFSSENDDLFEGYYWTVCPVDFNVDELVEYVEYLCIVVVSAKSRGLHDANRNASYYGVWYPTDTLRLFLPALGLSVG